MDLLTLIAKLTVDDTEYEKGLSDAERKAKDSEKKMKQSIGKVAAVGAAAVGAFAAASVKTGAEFDKSMSQVAATMGKTMDDLKNEVATVDTAYGEFSGNLREYAQFMGANTVFSATQASEALNYMALAGYDVQKSMDTLPSVLNLAAAGGMDLARASDMVTDSESALGLTADQTATMIDQMAMTASKSNTSVEQLGDAILTVGGTATYMAGGTTELNEVLGLLADNGIKGSEAGTHLRNMILKLSSPTKEGTKALKNLGLEVFDNEGKMRSFSEIFPELNEKLSTLTDEQKLQALSDIFNTRDIASVNALLSTTGERWEELGGYIDDATGSAQQMADTQLDNLEGDITLLKSAFEGMQIQISDGLTPVLREAVQWLTGVISNFETWAPIVIGLATAFGTLAIALNFGTIISTLSTAFTTLWTVLSANPIGVVIAIIAGLVTALVTAWNTNENFRNAVTTAWENIKSKAQELGDKFNDIKEKIASAIESARDRVGAAIERMKSFFNFSWSLPKLKLPHFKITGGFSLIPPSVPKFDVEWYKKAYQGIMKFPQNTVLQTADGLKGFSDGVGSEVLMSEQHFLNTLQSAEAQGRTATTMSLLEEIRSLKDAIMGIDIRLDTGTLVGEMAPSIDNTLGSFSVYKERGN